MNVRSALSCHLLLVALALSWAPAAHAQKKTVLPNGIRGSLLGEGYKEVMRNMRKHFPEAKWSCERNSEVAYKGNVTDCMAYGFKGELSFGSGKPTSILLSFDRGEFVEAFVSFQHFNEPRISTHNVFIHLVETINDLNESAMQNLQPVVS